MKKLLIARWPLMLFLIASAAAAQNETKQTASPIHGQVLAAYLGAEATGSAGIVGTVKKWVYRVDCGDHYYDLQGKRKQSLSIGQEIDFRMDKEKAYLLGDKKGTSYRIVGMGKADQKLIQKRY